MIRRHWLGAALVVALSALAIWATLPTKAHGEREPIGPVVKVLVNGGHGSGVSIGGGFYLTAAHVVKDAETVTLRFETAEITTGEVLWANESYDVALIRADKFYSYSELSCRAPSTGEPVTLHGHPGGVVGFESAGRIGGPVQQIGKWESVLVVDATAGRGMSGGPVYDAQGRIVGLTVGLMLQSVGPSPSMMAIVYAVPGRAICRLLARR